MENTLNVMEEINVREEMEAREREGKGDGFVQMSYSAEDAFTRMDAIKRGMAIIKAAVESTGGIMPIKTRDAYEIFYGAAEAIKTYEMDTVRNGR